MAFVGSDSDNDSLPFILFRVVTEDEEDEGIFSDFDCDVGDIPSFEEAGRAKTFLVESRICIKTQESKQNEDERTYDDFIEQQDDGPIDPFLIT